MNLIKFIIKRYVGTLLIIFIFIILGLFAYNSLAVSFYPDFSVPAVFITTIYPGADPESIEEEITKVIEEAVSAIAGIDEITSSSQEGFSLVRISFAFGENIDEKNREIQKKIDQVKLSLPRDADLPNLLTINDFLAPPIELAITSGQKELGELKLLAENRIAPALSRLPGVASVNITGGTELIVKVMLDPKLLRETGINFSQVANALEAENVDLPIGEIRGERNTFTLRVNGRFQTLSDLENTIVGRQSSALIRLKNIARIEIQEKKQTRFARINGKKAIGLIIRKPSGGNSIQIADQVKKWLKNEKSKLPVGVQLDVVSDESIFIKNSISNVFNSLLLGALLASIVIFLFLGNVRNTLVIILSIPTTLIISFGFMRIFNLSLNTVSLGGMGMAVGMIVDSAIVVMENIFRHLEMQDLKSDRRSVIAYSAREVILAISASVLTTIVVFLPQAFTRGLAKVLLGELALVIVFALFVSLLVAVSFVPLLSYFLLKIEYKRNLFSRLFLMLVDRIKMIYLKTLGMSLNHKWLTLLFFVCLFMASLFLAGQFNTSLFPESDQGQFQIIINYPRGTGVNYTNQEVKKIEDWLLKQNSIRLVSTVVGEDIFFGTLFPYQATINVFTEKKYPTNQVIKQVRSHVNQLPGVNAVIRMVDASAGFNRQDIDLTISGDDLQILRRQADQLREQISQEKGMLNVESNLQKGLPSFIFLPDRTKIAQLGLTVAEVARMIRTGKSGLTVTRFQQPDYTIDVEINLEQSDLYRLDDIRNMPVPTREAGIVPLKALGQFIEGEAPSEINHIALRRTVNISGDFDPLLNQRQLKKNLDQIVNQYQLPEGYFFDKARSSRAIAESFQTLGIALLIAILLVYVIIGVQFNSFGLPLLIAFSIPFSFPGAFFLMFITNTPLNLPSFLGLIMLAGIVVNNGIIFLDFVISFSKQYDSLEKAILAAGQVRFRPILMTTLTTVFGMLFLALDLSGGGSALKPLAIAVIGGLSYSILVSLILIPVLYALFYRKKIKSKSRQSDDKKLIPE